MIIHILLSQLTVDAKPVILPEKTGEWITRNLQTEEVYSRRWNRVLLMKGKVKHTTDIPYARMELGAVIPDTVLLYVKGEGTYDVRLTVEKGGSILSTRKVVRASGEWKPVILLPGRAVPIVGGLAENPGAGVWTSLRILPHRSKGEEFPGNTFLLYVSPVFVKGR